MRYLYNLDKVWYAGKWESINVEPAKHIAYNVTRITTDHYEFNLTEFDESIKFQTSYGWSLIEISETNLLLFAERLDIERRKHQLAQDWHDITLKIKTIEHHS